MEYKISVHCQNFIAMNKSKPSEPMKKVKWLTPSQISEQIVDSNSYKSGSDTVTMEEEKGYEEVGTESLLHGDWACTQSHYTKNVPVRKWHTPSASEDEQGGPLDRHHSNQQPCAGHCPVALQIVWYTYTKGAPEERSAPFYLAFSCCILWKLWHCSWRHIVGVAV
jgi:hypothetical protein